uniref:Uncharacterized protein n=1 Tax=Onchocerca volvulus TaxID=6282 RepID=A0A8R1TRQ6_ONCVO
MLSRMEEACRMIHFLSEHLCDSLNWSEAQNDRAEIKDEKYDKVNLVRLNHFSSLLQLQALWHQLESYILHNYIASVENLLEMIIEAMNASFPDDLLFIFVSEIDSI